MHPRPLYHPLQRAFGHDGMGGGGHLNAQNVWQRVLENRGAAMSPPDDDSYQGMAG
jgi:hypothetical protein